jgi:hypothetical protein
VALNADRGGVCKFGLSQTDQENLKLMRGNINDLYKQALKKSELAVIPSAVEDENLVADKNSQERFAKLQENTI